ncbi:hypothetical protein H9P43_001583 [Blastocladiella emersonii ATCC 22665]|nr:hypothetical protein H9P43_001579 [Blastocladiella emersonii ATCC 22665]KAI9190150.1 hypothetical protein H9P43_001583 [Blastocladiella emersonii ATCC 22665]
MARAAPLLLLLLALAHLANAQRASTSTRATAAPAPTAVPAAACPNGIRTRRAFSSLSATEKKAFSDAIMSMKRSGQLDQFTRKHRTGMRYHMTTQFLPMHRALLVEFEDALIKASNNVLTGLPYWNELADSRAPTRSSIFTTSGLGEMKAGPLSAPFAGLTDDTGRIVTRNPWVAPNNGAFEWLPQSQVMAEAMRRFRTFGEMSNTIENSPHNSWHGIVGGHMGDPNISPADPTFWAHHCYIDLLWATWQGLSPANFVNLDTAAGELKVEASAGTVLYESRYTNRDMLYYRSRLCYTYDSVPNNVGPGERAQRALRALREGEAASNSTSTATASASATVTKTATATSAVFPTPLSVNATAPFNGTAPAAAPANQTNVTALAAANSTTTTTITAQDYQLAAVAPMPEVLITKLMPMIPREVAIAKMRAAEAALNAVRDDLNREIAVKANDNPAYVATLPTIQDLTAESAAFVAAAVKDDYSESAIPAVQALSTSAGAPSSSKVSSAAGVAAGSAVAVAAAAIVVALLA